MADQIGDLAHRLRGARKHLGLSQEFVAGKLDIPRSALSDIEQAKRNVSAPELQRFAILYGQSTDRLLNGQSAASESSSITALARAADDLTEEDREQVLEFAEFLRNRARSKTDDSN